MTWNKALAYLVAYGMAYCLICLAWTVLMSEAVPKRLKQKYLCKPYFSKMEAAILQIYPKKLHLGLYFSLMMATPKLGKKRGLENAHLDAPDWWKKLSLLYFWLALIPILLWLCLTISFVFTAK